MAVRDGSGYEVGGRRDKVGRALQLVARNGGGTHLERNDKVSERQVRFVALHFISEIYMKASMINFCLMFSFLVYRF